MLVHHTILRTVRSQVYGFALQVFDVGLVDASLFGTKNLQKEAKSLEDRRKMYLKLS